MNRWVRLRALLQADVERLLWANAHDGTKPYSIRKASIDAFIGFARTADARACSRSACACSRPGTSW